MKAEIISWRLEISVSLCIYLVLMLMYDSFSTCLNDFIYSTFQAVLFLFAC